MFCALFCLWFGGKNTLKTATVPKSKCILRSIDVSLYTCKQNSLPGYGLRNSRVSIYTDGVRTIHRNSSLVFVFLLVCIIFFL